MNQIGEILTKKKFNYQIVFWIALAVFAQEISWNYYDVQVPVSLSKYIQSAGLIGFIMGFNYLIGIIIQPIMGNLSDNTRTKLGRRLPFILIGTPLAAIFFALIAFEKSLPTLLVCIFMYVSTMLAYKAPTESLMPDYVVPEHRSKGNAILKIVTSLTVIFSAGLSLLIVDKHLQLSFIIPSVIMLLTIPFLLAKIKEKDSLGYQQALKDDENESKSTQTKVSKVKLLPTFLEIFKSKDKSRLFMLLTVFFASVSWQSMRTLVTTYATINLNMTRGEAGGLTLPGGIAFLLLAFPIAWLSEKFGRKLAMLIGIGIMILGCILGFVFPSPMMMHITVTMIAIAWATVSINAIVMVWNLARSSKESGTYTGLYYFFYYAGAASGPAIVGFLTDLNGWHSYWLNISLFTVAAFVMLLLVKNVSNPTIETEN
jgi:Na+/melibiose symporter-like transporter